MIFSWYSHLGYQNKLQMFLRYEVIMLTTMKTTVLSTTTPSIVVRYRYFCLRRKNMTVTNIMPFEILK